MMMMMMMKFVSLPCSHCARHCGLWWSIARTPSPPPRRAQVNVVGEHVFIGQRATLTDSGDVPRAVGAPADVEAETPRAPPDPEAGGADDFSAEIGRLSKFEPVSEAQQGD
jgi:hypothetical protein